DEVDVAHQPLVADSERAEVPGLHLAPHDGRGHEAHAIAHLHGALDDLVGADLHGRPDFHPELLEPPLDELPAGGSRLAENDILVPELREPDAPPAGPRMARRHDDD